MATEFQNPGRITAVTGAKIKISLKKRLTISALAEKLKKIEKESGFDMATWAVSQINYQKILNLVNPADEIDAPALMPSKYMLLPFVSESELKAKGNLNNLPFGHSPLNTVSFANLELFLSYCDGIAGNSVAMVLDENGNLAVSTNTEKISSHVELTQTLLKTLNTYIDASNSMLDENLLKGVSSHTVVEHDSLSSIAKNYGIKNWGLLLELNKSTLGDDWDILKPGTKLKLPDPNKNPLKDWMIANGWDDYLTDKGYQYPGKYLSLTLLDLEGKKIEKLDPPAKCEVYCKNETADLIYSFDLESGEIDLVVPDCEIGWGIQGITSVSSGQMGMMRKEYLEWRNKQPKKDPNAKNNDGVTHTSKEIDAKDELDVDFLIHKLSGPYFLEIGKEYKFKVEEVKLVKTDEIVPADQLSSGRENSINWKIIGESFESSFDKHGLELEQFIPLAWAGQKLKVHAYRVKPSDKVKVDSAVVPFASYDGFHLKWINVQGKEEKVWDATGNLPKGSWMALPEALEQLQAQENKVNRIPIMPFKNVTDEKAGESYSIFGHNSGNGNTGANAGDKINEIVNFLKAKMGKIGIGVRSEGGNSKIQQTAENQPQLYPDLSKVPFYCQVDSEWASVYITTKTIGKIGCGLTSVSMFLKYFGRDVNPKTLDTYLDDNKGYDGNLISFGVALKYKEINFTQKFKYNGVITTDLDTKISAQLEKKIPVIASVGYGDVKSHRHFVVIVGKDSDGNYIMNDPGASDGNGAKDPKDENKIEKTTRKSGYNLIRILNIEMSSK